MSNEMSTFEALQRAFQRTGFGVSPEQVIGRVCAIEYEESLPDGHSGEGEGFICHKQGCHVRLLLMKVRAITFHRMLHEDTDPKDDDGIQIFFDPIEVDLDTTLTENGAIHRIEGVFWSTRGAWYLLGLNMDLGHHGNDDTDPYRRLNRELGTQNLSVRLL